MGLTEKELLAFRDIEARLRESSPDLVQKLAPRRLPPAGVARLTPRVSRRPVAAMVVVLVVAQIAGLAAAGSAISAGARTAIAVVVVIVDVICMVAVVGLHARARGARRGGRWPRE